MEEFVFHISSLESEIKKGKNYVLIDPIHDSKMKVLIGTQKILTEKDIVKIKELFENNPHTTIHVRTAIPHYIEEDKRVKWVSLIISNFEAKDYVKKLTYERKDFITKYLKSIIKEDDYVVWKLYQLKNFSKKLFDHSLNTCFIALITYYNYNLMNQSGMIDGKMVENVINASLLQSIGLLKNDAKMLEKKRVEIVQNRLSEFYQHTSEAYKILKSETARHDLPEEVLQAVLNHEEFADGSGSPRGLDGNDMPFLAKLLSLANYFELLLSGEWSLKDRTSREHCSKLRQERKKFDPQIFEALDSSFKTLF